MKSINPNNFKLTQVDFENDQEVLSDKINKMFIYTYLQRSNRQIEESRKIKTAFMKSLSEGYA